VEDLLEVLARYEAAARVPLDGKLSRVLEPEQELRRLDAHIERLRANPLDGRSGAQPRLDIDNLWRRWGNTQGDLASFSRRELRALCWDHRAAGSPEFLAALALNGHIPQRRSFLRGLWHAHQQHWRLPTAEQLEQLFSQGMDMTGYRPRWMRILSDRPKLLGRFAPLEVAHGIEQDAWSADAMFDRTGVTPGGSLGQLGIEAARAGWLEAVHLKRSIAEVGELVRAGRLGLIAREHTALEQFRPAIERLLACVPGSSPALRDALAQLIVEDSRLGRPTQPSAAPNWVGFSREARATAVRLFAARDLKAFFEVLLGAHGDDQLRRSFWERYVNSPQLVDFAIASDASDRRLLLARRGERNGDVARLASAPDSHSAFIMRFNGRSDLVIAEISRPHNAMYLFDIKVFEDVVGRLDRGVFDFRKLKDRSVAREWWSHTGNMDRRDYWHEKFSQKLGAYGIYQGGRW
jgi:hypothetical protein